MVSNLHERGIILPGLAACENLDAQKKRLVLHNVFMTYNRERYRGNYMRFPSFCLCCSCCLFIFLIATCIQHLLFFACYEPFSKLSIFNKNFFYF